MSLVFHELITNAVNFFITFKIAIVYLIASD